MQPAGTSLRGMGDQERGFAIFMYISNHLGFIFSGDIPDHEDCMEYSQMHK